MRAARLWSCVTLTMRLSAPSMEATHESCWTHSESDAPAPGDLRRLTQQELMSGTTVLASAPWPPAATGSTIDRASGGRRYWPMMRALVMALASERPAARDIPVSVRAAGAQRRPGAQRDPDVSIACQ